MAGRHEHFELKVSKLYSNHKIVLGMDHHYGSAYGPMVTDARFKYGSTMGGLYESSVLQLYVANLHASSNHYVHAVMVYNTEQVDSTSYSRYIPKNLIADATDPGDLVGSDTWAQYTNTYSVDLTTLFT